MSLMSAFIHGQNKGRVDRFILLFRANMGYILDRKIYTL